MVPRDGLFPGLGYFITVFQNLTNHMEKENMLFEMQGKYRSIFDYVPLGVANISMDGHFFDVNKEFSSITGYSKEELLTMSFQDITYAEDQGKSYEALLRMKEGLLSVFRVEKRYTHKNQSIIWVDLTVMPVLDAKETLLYFVTTISDITQQKRKRIINFI